MPINEEGQEVIILGNGPSLNTTLSQSKEFVRTHRLVAVNFAANTAQFKQLRPHYYVLADPHFFKAVDQDNVKELWQNLMGVDWDMVLCIPARVKPKGKIWKELRRNRFLTIVRFNMTGIEGFSWLENWAYDNMWGSPRPRNVLIPALMLCIAAGFKTIYLAGADHSWTKTLSVNEDNEVVSIQPHFYDEDAKEQSRITSVYRNIRLHELLLSFHIAFKSYFTIQRYAVARGVKIFNITPDSFIDAFPRKRLPQNLFEMAESQL